MGESINNDWNKSIIIHIKLYIGWDMNKID